MAWCTEALVDIAARRPVAFPADIALAVVMTSTEMDAHGIDGIAVVLVHYADVDLIFAPFTIEGSPRACPSVVDIYTVALPLAHVLVARGAILAWPTGAFVHIDVTVAPSFYVCREPYRTKCCVVLNNLNVGVMTPSIRIPIKTRTGVATSGQTRVGDGLST